MREQDLIKRTINPVTKDSLIDDFKKLGIKAGAVVLVHSSLSSIGWVSGGERSVVEALMEVVTDEGTIIMPTHSANLSDPASWENPPVPENWQTIIRDTMPAFHTLHTPTYFMGKIVEAFRHYPDVIRSDHPTVSFAAWGNHKRFITKDHSLDHGLGEASPLAKIYHLNGQVLLIGVDFDNNTSMHLAEHRAGGKEILNASPIMENGKRVWKVYRELEYRDELFNEIGKSFEKHAPVRIGNIGMTKAKFMNQKSLVDFTTEWLKGKGPQICKPL